MCSYDKFLEEYGPEEVAKKLFNSAYVMKRKDEERIREWYD
jgi:hypothetical protein